MSISLRKKAEPRDCCLGDRLKWLMVAHPCGFPSVASMDSLSWNGGGLQCRGRPPLGILPGLLFSRKPAMGLVSQGVHFWKDRHHSFHNRLPTSTRMWPSAPERPFSCIARIFIPEANSHAPYLLQPIFSKANADSTVSLDSQSLSTEDKPGVHKNPQSQTLAYDAE
jgi:hypothetical protein